MEALSFLLQRFYWTFGASCIINFFVIVNYFILLEKIALHEELQFLNELKNISPSFAIMTFIVAVVIISIFLEGINEVGYRYFLENTKKIVKKEYKDNPKKIWELQENESIYNKFDFIGKVLYFTFRKTTYRKVFEEILINKKGFPEPIYAFMFDHDDSDNFILGIQIWSRKIANAEKNSGVYMYSDLSFMMELISFSFLIVFLFSVLAIIPITILYGIQFLFWWYLASIVLSILFFFLADLIALYFIKRHIRDIGISYKSLKLKRSFL
ncbi:MAG: hypothetical protein FWH22_02950 [Fibromonadales bacterium]|nr:hypothetical protein [Fibromonadales bacterium]